MVVTAARRVRSDSTVVRTFSVFRTTPKAIYQGPSHHGSNVRGGSADSCSAGRLHSVLPGAYGSAAVIFCAGAGGCNHADDRNLARISVRIQAQDRAPSAVGDSQLCYRAGIHWSPL